MAALQTAIRASRLTYFRTFAVSRVSLENGAVLGGAYEKFVRNRERDHPAADLCQFSKHILLKGPLRADMTRIPFVNYNNH